MPNIQGEAIYQIYAQLLSALGKIDEAEEAKALANKLINEHAALLPEAFQSAYLSSRIYAQ